MYKIFNLTANLSEFLNFKIYPIIIYPRKSVHNFHKYTQYFLIATVQIRLNKFIKKYLLNSFNIEKRSYIIKL